LPSVGIRGGAGVEKVGRYTNIGTSEATTDVAPETETPEPLPDYMLTAFASWEVDIWRKMRNVKKAAVSRYLSSVEGKNFLVTNLIAEIATPYYELLALDNQLDNQKRQLFSDNAGCHAWATIVALYQALGSLAFPFSND
jgi:multidrug efflux system outer membrane protein